MNTVTLPRGDWVALEVVIARFIADYDLKGGSIECLLGNIQTQLDKQEY